MITAPETQHPHRGARVSERQQLLILYLSSSDITSWAYFDGHQAGGVTLDHDLEHPPYDTALAALQDGWRLIKYPTLQPHSSGMEAFDISYFQHEFVFEKWRTT